MSVLNRFAAATKAFRTPEIMQGEPAADSWRGYTTNTDRQIEELMPLMQPDHRLYQTIIDIRNMDAQDGRVKKIHGKTARQAVKGGLTLRCSPNATRIRRVWDAYHRRCKLDRKQKLESDLRGLMMEGNLPLQPVLNSSRTQVVRVIRMHAETIRPVVGINGQFVEPATRAYEQWSTPAGEVVAAFPLWQLGMSRLQPGNYDDMGSLGRPYLDATREVWQQLRMIEKDLVVRRHVRAPMRLAHSLEGAEDAALKAYEAKAKSTVRSIVKDFFSNKKLTVQPIQGDANLDQIADVVFLLDTFFGGAPAPKGLFGYPGDLQRDILEDLKRDYFEELDALQETTEEAYEHGFMLELLLNGINPMAEQWSIEFAERNTETKNQQADRALKLQALGIPDELVWGAAGFDPRQVRDHIEDAMRRGDPYPRERPDPDDDPAKPTVKVTPGNQRKSESATSIQNA